MKKETSRKKEESKEQKKESKESTALSTGASAAVAGEREALIPYCSYVEDYWKDLWKENLRLRRLLCKSNSECYIMKEIKREKFRSPTALVIQQPIEELTGQLKLARQQKSSCIQHLIDMRTDSQYMYYLYDDTKGMSLKQHFIAKKTHLADNELRAILDSFLRALNTYHEAGLAHGDLKLDNIIIEGEADQMIVRLTDMTSVRFPSLDCQWLFTAIENSMYLAPEVLSSNHVGAKADIWSFGVIIYILTHSTTPFGYAQGEITQHIEQGVYQISRSCSEACADLIAQCLQAEHRKRPTCTELLAHPFFRPPELGFEDIGSVLEGFYTLNCHSYQPLIRHWQKNEESKSCDITHSLSAGEDKPANEDFEIVEKQSKSKKASAVINKKVFDDVQNIDSQSNTTMLYYVDWPGVLFLYNLDSKKRARFRLPFKIISFVATAYTGNTLFISGGCDVSIYSAELKGVEIYPSMNWFKTSKLPSMHTPRVNHKMLVTLPRSALVTVGGSNASGTLASTELYDIANKRWILGPALTIPRRMASIVKVGFNTLCTIGGWHEDKYLNSIELCYIEGNAEAFGSCQWTLVELEGMPGVCNVGAVQVEPKVILIFGGNVGGVPSLKSSKLVFRTWTKKVAWSQTGCLLDDDVFVHTQPVLRHNNVYVFGWTHKSLHMYSLKDHQWTLQLQRHWLPSTLLCYTRFCC